MGKKIFLFCLLLMMIISCILLFQWKGYSSKKEAKLNIKQTVEFRHKNNQFVIKQIISDIPEGVYDIQLPAKAKEMSCISGDADACQWADQKRKKLTVNKDTITFTYTLTPPRDPDYLLLNDWGITMIGIDPVFTRIQMTEKQWRKGSWAAGANLAGKEKMDGLDYYVFESKSIPALFWQKAELIEHTINENLMIYTEKNNLPDASVLNKISPDDQMFVIVTSHMKKITEQKELLLVPETAKSVEDDLIRSLLSKKLHVGEEDQWLIDLIASLITEHPPQGKKINKMHDSLVEGLTGKQLDNWLDIVLSTDTKITGDLLDAAIKDVAGFKTDFFQKNINTDHLFHPFYIFDGRDVQINDRIEKEITVLLHNGRTYILFRPLMLKLGFKEQLSEPDELIIEKQGKVYRFMLNKKLFTVDDEQYGFSENPFFRDKDDIYIDKAWLSQLFGLDIQETGGTIFIKGEK